jgi:hypothetical protein
MESQKDSVAFIGRMEMCTLVNGSRGLNMALAYGRDQKEMNI